MSGLPEQHPFEVTALLVTLLAAISWIDFRRLIIPDILNVALAAGGLCYQWAFNPGEIWDHLLAALLLVGMTYGIRHIHLQRTGVVGLGLGDVKFVGAAALWISPWQLPTFILVASGSALIFVFLARLVRERSGQGERIPFAPFLSIGLLAVWAGEVFNLPNFMVLR